MVLSVRVIPQILVQSAFILLIFQELRSVDKQALSSYHHYSHCQQIGCLATQYRVREKEKEKRKNKRLCSVISPSMKPFCSVLPSFPTVCLSFYNSVFVFCFVLPSLLPFLTHCSHLMTKFIIKTYLLTYFSIYLLKENSE